MLLPLAAFVLLAFGVPFTLSIVHAGAWLKANGFEDSLQYLFIVVGLTLLFLIVMALRRVGLQDVLLELGFGARLLQPVLVGSLAAVVMVACLLIAGRRSTTLARRYRAGGPRSRAGRFAFITLTHLTLFFGSLRT